MLWWPNIFLMVPLSHRWFSSLSFVIKYHTLWYVPLLVHTFPIVQNIEKIKTWKLKIHNKPRPFISASPVQRHTTRRCFLKFVEMFAEEQNTFHQKAGRKQNADSKKAEINTSQTGIWHFGQTLPCFAGFIQSRQHGKASWLGPMASGSSLE